MFKSKNLATNEEETVGDAAWKVAIVVVVDAMEL